MRRLGTQVALLLVLALPTTAAANDFQNVYRQYKRTGTIKPCKFSDHQLANAEKQTPPDVEQYAPSFLDALQSARERNADCNKKAAPAPAPTPTQPTPAPAPTASTPTPAATPTATVPAPTATTATPPPAPTVPVQPKVAAPSPPIAGAKQHDSTPAAVVLLAILGALILLSALFAGLAWWFGWSAERFVRPWAASWDDFGSRLSDVGIEFREWLRTGV